MAQDRQRWFNFPLVLEMFDSRKTYDRSVPRKIGNRKFLESKICRFYPNRTETQASSTSGKQNREEKSRHTESWSSRGKIMVGIRAREMKKAGERRLLAGNLRRWCPWRRRRRRVACWESGRKGMGILFPFGLGLVGWHGGITLVSLFFSIIGYPKF